MTSLASGPALAADTVETWDVGATDVDFYGGLEGLGASAGESAIYADIMLGYGLIDRLSAYLGATLEGDGLLGNGQAGLYLGVFGTAVNTDHFDLDLFLDVSLGGDGVSVLQVEPAVELNFDLDPERLSWGAYLRLGMPIYGTSRALDPSGAVEQNAAFSVTVNPGAYLTVADGHQILLELDVSFPGWPAGEHPVEVGGIALGYNVVLNESIELINQLFVDIPPRDETAAVGVMVGFIATMPSSR